MITFYSAAFIAKKYLGFAPILSAYTLYKVVTATLALLLVACGGGGGGDTTTVPAPALQASFNAAKDGIVLSWSNPEDLRDITITRYEFDTSAPNSNPLGTPDSKTYDSSTTLALGRMAITSGNVQAFPVEGTFATNRYYRFDITRTFTDNRTDTLTSSPNPLYLPPKVTGVTTELTADRTGAFISWTNPASSEALQEIIITRNEFDSPALNSDDIRGTESTRHRDLSAVLSTSVAGGMDANVTINNVFAADRYYTFSVTPVYVGSAVGAASPPSPRQYFPPADAILDLTATLNPDRTSVSLTWTNPQSIAEITDISIIIAEFTDFNTNSQVTEYTTDATDENFDEAPEAIRQGNARFTITSSGLLDPTLYYTFIVVPIYDGDVIGRASEPTKPRIQVEVDLATVIPIVADDERSVVLHYENPPGVTSIDIAILSYDVETGGTATSSSAVRDDSRNATKDVQPRTTIDGLEAGVFHEFTITRTFAAGSSGTATATTPFRTILVPGVSNVQAAFDPAEAMVTLSWDNPENVEGLNITSQTYTDASAGTAVGPAMSMVYSEASDIMPGPVSRNLTLAIDSGKFYTFTVTPIYVASVIGITSEPTTPLQLTLDDDGDGVLDINDIDDDGDGLIELRTAAELNMMRNNLAGTGLDADNSDGNLYAGGDDAGCGGSSSGDADSCNGYELMVDIDLNDLPKNATTGSNWKRVGFCTAGRSSSCTSNAFTGNFDGNNNKISNMRIYLPVAISGHGFFGSVANADIRNIILTNASMSFAPTIQGDLRGYIGVLVGYGNNLNITFAAVTIQEILGATAIDENGLAPSIDSSIGALVGRCVDCTITSSATLMNRVSGIYGMGGLAGRLFSSKIFSSVAVTNDIKSSHVAFNGGLIGGLYNGGEAAFSTAITNTATINEGKPFGGLVGRTSSSFIHTSYGIQFGGMGALVGLLSGEDFATDDDINTEIVTVVESSYYNATATGSGAPNGSGIALNMPQLQPTAFADDSNGGNFTSWADGWCDTTTGEFTQNRTNDLATGVNANGVPAWDLVPDGPTRGDNSFPIPACTPFSPATLRTAIGKVRNAESPVPIER